MAPAAQNELELNNHTSEVASRDSPLRRQFPERSHARSISITTTQTSRSPSPVSKSKCDWCGMYFMSRDGESPSSARKKHIASVHPHIARFSLFEGTRDDDEEEEEEEGGEEDEEGDGDDEGSHLLDDDDPAEHENEISLLEIGSQAEDDDNIEIVEDDIVEDDLVEGADVIEMYDDNEKADLDGDEPELDVEVPEGDSDLALISQLHEFSREEDTVSLEKRLHHFWNVHDIRKFSVDYDIKSTGMGQTWTNVFQDLRRGKKRDGPEISERPDPYKKTKVARGEFLEITPLEDFLVQLRDPELRSSDELYAITENVAYALKAWQDEYLALDKLHKVATRHNGKPTSDPRKLERPAVFEDKKEAMLYGYKHDPKEDKVGNQNPFVQGGFKPTPAQFRKMTAKAGPNNPNPDGWPTVTKFGIEHVPKFQNPPREEFVGKATRKRKAAELEAASRANETDEATETPAPPDHEQEYSAKRRARTRRQAAEVELADSGSMPSTRNRGRGGRVRGRGAARAGSRATSETPIALAPSANASRSAISRAQVDGSASVGAGRAQLVPIEPAPSGGSLAGSATKPQTGGAQDEAIDPTELARRQKIANSKNPKRTEAMLNHWARFNREGRVRNPKRSKAQIEADRAAEAAKKAVEPPKPVGKKKKSASPGFTGPTRGDAGIAPARPTIPASNTLAPGPPTQPPQLAPIPARGPIAPYPPPPLGQPMDPRAVAPFPAGPRGPLQPPPPQPYHTPYPDYYIPYGAAATGLPPPGHPRPA